MRIKDLLTYNTFPGTQDATRQLIFYIAVFILIYSILFYFINRTNHTITKHIFILVPLIIYTIIILKITILDRDYTVLEYYNFDLFWSYRYNYQYPGNYYVFWQTVQNVLLFIPFGYLLSHYNYKITAISTGICSFALSLSVETYQFIAKVGLCEYDDIFNNTLGGLLGISLYYFQKNLFEKRWLKSVLCLLPCLFALIISKLLLYSYS